VDYFNAIVLAIVEGITEFLPVSSTGHLILAESALHFGDDRAFIDAFIVIIQLPAILSVCIYFWSDLWPVKEGKVNQQTLVLWSKVIAAFVPAIVLGLLLDDWLESLFDNWIVAVALIVGGIIIILVERRSHEGGTESIHELTFKQAVAIGFFQCLAMIPGTSRSGATIVGGLLLGARRSVAAEFSFFLAIPTMVGATAFKVMKNGVDFSMHQWTLILIGSIVAFVVAYAVVAFLMSFIKKHSFHVFGVYRIVIGVLVLIFLYAR
jgi:undecaprenyl-diphosphatase